MIWIISLIFFATIKVLKGLSTSDVQFIAKGEFPVENSDTQDHLTEDQISAFSVGTLGIPTLNFQMTITGWINTGDPQTITQTQSKIQVFNKLYLPEKLLFFGNDDSKFYLRYEILGNQQANCSLTYNFKTTYRFIISVSATISSITFSMTFSTLDGTVTTSTNSSNYIFIITNLFWLTVHFQKPNDNYAYSNQIMGGITLIRNYFHSSSDLETQKFLLGYGSNSYQLFYFKFSHEQMYCDCFIDSTSNHIQALLSLGYSSLTSSGGGGFFIYAFTNNQIISFPASNLRFGHKSDSIYQHIVINKEINYLNLQQVSLSFWIKIDSSVSTFKIFEYRTASSTFIVSISLISGTAYQLQVNDFTTSKVLYSLLSSNQFYHCIIAVNYGYIELYIGGTYIQQIPASFHTFFQGQVDGSEIQIGGDIFPLTSKVYISQFRLFTSTAILSSNSLSPSLILNCLTLIQEQSTYKCVLCQRGYLLHNNGQCVSSCSSTDQTLLEVQMCASACPYGCSSCSDQTICTGCLNNRILNGARCECPSGTYEDYRSNKCFKIKKLTKGCEFGQFLIQQELSKKIYFNNYFSAPPKVIFSLMSFSNDIPDSAPIKSFYISISSMTKTYMVLTTNSVTLNNLHYQYFAYESNSNLFESGMIIMDLPNNLSASSQQSVTSQFFTANNYNVHIFLGGFSCTQINSFFFNQCNLSLSINENNIEAKTTTFLSNFFVESVEIYYLITPKYIEFNTASINYSNNNLYDTSFSDQYCDKLLPVNFLDSSLNSVIASETQFDILSLDVMYSFTGFTLNKYGFLFLKIQPMNLSLSNSTSILHNLELLFRTYRISNVIIGYSLFLNSFNFVSQCQYADYYTNQCVKCNNGKDLSSNCQCNTGFFLKEADCVCKDGEWEDTTLGICKPCHSSCTTCSSLTTCTTCLGALIFAPSGLCKCSSSTPSWYDLSGTCNFCNLSCETCSNTTSCDTCYSGTNMVKGNTNFCECPQGFWYKSSTITCNQCYLTCKTCNDAKSGAVESCLSCKGNRNLVLNSCICQYSGDSRIFSDDLNCSQDQMAVLDPILSSDFTEINIDFGVSITPSSSLPSSSYALCEQLFNSATLTLLGTDSVCSISANQVQISLGILARIVSGDPISYLPNTIMLAYNSQYITDYRRATLKQQTPAVVPSMSFEYLPIQNSCFAQTAKIASISNDGKRGLKQLTWVLVSISFNDEAVSSALSAVLSDANKNQNQSIEIFMHMATNNLNIVIRLDWIAWVQSAIVNSYSFSIDVKIGKVIQYQYQYSYPQPFFRFKDLTIDINFQSLTCNSKGELVIVEEGVNAEIQNSSLNIHDSYTNLLTKEASVFIPAFSQIAELTYPLVVTLTLTNNPTISSTFTIDLFFALSSLRVVIIGGNRLLNYHLPSTIIGEFFDYESQFTPQSISDVNLNWSCIDLSTSNVCKNTTNQPIAFINNALTENFFPNAFPAYTVTQITLEATQVYSPSITRIKRNSVIIFFTEMDIPSLDVMLDDRLSSDYTVNLNQIIHSTLSYDPSVNAETLLYTGAILYAKKVVATISFDYRKIRFQLWDYYNLFNESNPIVQVRFSAYNPSYVVPSLTTLKFTINFPPKNCVLSVKPQYTPFYSVSTKFLISMDGCVDNEDPIQYQFFYYQSLSLFQLEKENSLKVQRKQLSELSQTNYINTILPAGSIIILARAIDNRDAISNCTFTITIDQDTFTPSTYFSFVTTFLSDIINFIPESQIVQLDFLVTDLLSGGSSFLSPSQLDSYKIQIINLINQAKLNILSLSNTYQLATQVISSLLSSMQLSSTETAQKLSDLSTTLSSMSSKCTTSQDNQSKYQKCIENTFLIYNQLISITTNSGSLDANNNADFILHTEKIGDILTQYALPNENSITYNSGNIEIKSQKISQKFLSQYLGFQQESRILAQFDGMDRFLAAEEVIYDVSMKTYSENYYSQDPSQLSYTQQLANKTNNTQTTKIFPTINPSIKSQSNASQINLTRGISHFFSNIASPSQNLTCFNKDKNWTTSRCQTSIIAKTNEIRCLCPDLSSVTIVEDIGSLFTSNKNINTAFSSAGISNLSNWINFYSYIIFWVLLGQTVGLIVCIIKGKSLDANSIALLKKQRPKSLLKKAVAKIFPMSQLLNLKKKEKDSKTPSNIKSEAIELTQFDKVESTPQKLDIFRKNKAKKIQRQNPPSLKLKISQYSKEKDIDATDVDTPIQPKDQQMEEANNLATDTAPLSLKKKFGFSTALLLNIPQTPNSQSSNRKQDEENDLQNMQAGKKVGLDQQTELDKNILSLGDVKPKRYKPRKIFKYAPSKEGSGETNDIPNLFDQINQSQNEKEKVKQEGIENQEEKENQEVKQQPEEKGELEEEPKQRIIKSALEITKEEKEKLSSINKFFFFIYFHEFLSIFLVYYKEISRSVRFILYYLRYTHTLVISILFSSVAKSFIQTTFISLFSSVIISIFSKIVIVLLMKVGFLKKIGALITFLIITFYLYLILSVSSGNTPSKSNEFIGGYLQILGMDMIVTQTITAIIFGLIAKKVIKSKQENKKGLLFRIFDFLKMYLIVDSLLRIMNASSD